MPQASTKGVPAVRPGARTTRKTIADKEIGLRIRAVRIDQEVSQEELAKVLGISFQQVQKYENGANRIAASRLVKIAHILQTTPHELLGWEANTAKLERTAGNVQFDVASYKLSVRLKRLSPRVKQAMISLSDVLIDDEDLDGTSE